MLKYKVILNPVSGHGKGAAAREQVAAIFTDLNLEFDLAETQHSGQAAELSRQAVLDGYDRIVSVGGDGTANECLSGLMAARQEVQIIPAFGIVSLGNGNDLAYSVGAPINDIPAACQAIANDIRRWIDLGCVTLDGLPGKRYFANGIGIGFDAAVNIVASREKRLTGLPLYLVAALKTIFKYYTAPFVKLEFNQQTVEKGALMVSVMNGRRLGGGFYMAPHAMMDDGNFDLCIADQAGKAEILALIPRFMRGTQAGHPKIHNSRTTEIRIEALKGMLPIHADGETLSEFAKTVEIQLLPQQIEFVVSPDRVIT